MQIANIPVDEIDRLKALEKYKILDTHAEKAFDELTELASEICDTPIALISLIDTNRQWFKSKKGLSAEETSRDIAFCAHAIHQEQVFEVSDTHLDERFRDNPLVTEAPNIRFYAGAPLITPSGHKIGTLCAISDKPKILNIHQRKALEILGREVISQLELRSKVAQLEKANERKTEFLSSLSHELRTPLHGILSVSQLMLNSKTNALPADYKRYLQHLDVSGKRLLNLADSILDTCKLEDGILELNNNTIYCEDFFDNIKKTVQSMSITNAVEIEWNIMLNDIATFEIDGTRLCDIIFNIASNAIKFSHQNGKVKINVIVKKNGLTIAIKDEGIGISEDDLEVVFTKFERSPNKNKTEGVGLGMVITKKLLDLMDGNINIVSELTKGTLVKVKIPLHKTCTNNSHDNSSVLRQKFNINANILVVEDNVISQEIAKSIFMSIGIKIEIAESASKAILMARELHYDLIFMDIHLPDFDGLEASKIIIENNENQNIVAFTADVFVKNDPRMSNSGVKGVIYKPMPMTELFNVLNEYCPKDNLLLC